MQSKLKTIGIAALLVGTLDGLAAVIHYLLKGGDNPGIIFKFIASGIFGDSAFGGGTEIILAGILFHYLIATIWVVLFFTIYPRLKLKLNPYLVGIMYGMIVWAGMNLVVVPLSNTPSIPFSFSRAAVAMFILIIAIGLPISLVYHRYRR